MRYTLHHGECLQIMQAMPDASVDLTFTSPPYYNAREYSQYASYEAYLSFLESVFAEVYRITVDGRFLVVNTSPVIEPRLSRQHESKRYPIPFDMHPFLVKQGWEFVDDIIWVKPEGSAKNRNGGFLQHRKPLAYKPNCITEYVMVYRKQVGRLIDWSLRHADQGLLEQSRIDDTYQRTNVWYICPQHSKSHPAIFPEELAHNVVRYYSIKGDTVFDCFAGSGTTGAVAMGLERNFIGIEQDANYYAIAKQRIAIAAQSQQLELGA